MQHIEHALRHARSAHHIAQQVRASGHVAGVLEQRHIAGHQARREEANHLPERKIPRHHRQHAADGLVGDVAALCLGGDRLRLDVIGRVIGVVLAGGRTLLYLGQGLAAQLAHLDGHAALDVIAPLTQAGGDLSQVTTTCFKAQRGPCREGRLRCRQTLLDGGRRHQLDRTHGLAIEGIDCLVRRHGITCIQRMRKW
ncbi:hypothetical protein D3C81_1416890 [compost metagenome]